jgi:hypothetical protein
MDPFGLAICQEAWNMQASILAILAGEARGIDDGAKTEHHPALIGNLASSNPPGYAPPMSASPHSPWLSPEWLPHRYDPASDCVLFVRLPREAHQRLTFLSDEYVSKDAPRQVVSLGDAPGDIAQGACHYIFHSAFCCSTLIARALDLPGVAMGLKEPSIISDLAEAALSGGRPDQQRRNVARVLTLLARPFGAGEAVILKPSNVGNPVAMEMMAARPGAKALLMSSPLRRFLRSVAAKGMWGRIWARRVYGSLSRLPQIDPGYDEKERWLHTDLQVAALLWLHHQAEFARLIATFPGRVRVLQSNVLLAEKEEAMTAIASLFELAIDRVKIRAVIDGPAFSLDSKRMGEIFDPVGRTAAREAEAHGVYSEEIEMVAGWAEAVAAHVRVPMILPGALLG